jgi:hypothetical protein
VLPLGLKRPTTDSVSISHYVLDLVMKQNKKCEMAKGSRTLVRLWARFQWTIPAGDARQSHCVHPSRRGEASTHMCSWLPLIHTLTSDYVIFNLISWLPFPSTNNVGLNFALSPCINESSRFSMNYCEFKSAKPTKKIQHFMGPIFMLSGMTNCWSPILQLAEWE